MKYSHKSIFILILFSIFYLIFYIPKVSAQGEIASSHNVSYTILESGKTQVRHEVALTNLTTNYYASQYALILGFTDLSNIEARDSGGALETHITPKDNGTEIALAFNVQVVGKGKVLFFTISYETGEVASKNGRIWEINIPKIKNTDDLDDYTARLIVPASFGKPTYIKPATKDSLVFTKEDVLRGISVVFGNYQLFDFTLSYHLENKRLYPVLTEIALPPETAYQEILLEELVPLPLSVSQDGDGNWLARYRLEASTKLDVKARGSAKLFYTPRSDFQSSNEDLSRYLIPRKYWEAHDPHIAEKAKELATPKAIYTYVVELLTYDYQRIEKGSERAGALGAFTNPASAICMEFTDFFIALSRAAGIPAREIDGFAYTKNPKLRPLSLVADVLHAWPEYYDSERKQWVAVDPTWGNTSGIEYFDTFDFNHFAFVVKGLDSQYPSPAGSYKDSADRAKKDVEVTFASDDRFIEKRSVTVATNIKSRVVAGFPITGNILITNAGNKVYQGGLLTLSVDTLSPQTQEHSYTSIPPFGSITIPVSFTSTSVFDNEKAVLVASAPENQEFRFEIEVVPFYLLYLPLLGGGGGAALIFVIAYKARRIYFQKQNRASPLRRQSQQPSQTGFKLPWKKS